MKHFYAYLNNFCLPYVFYYAKLPGDRGFKSTMYTCIAPIMPFNQPYSV